jgi:hypothetical protein
MQQWRAIPVAIGGVVALGFLDEDRIIVGSHSGVGVFDVHTGERTERTYDDDDSWYQDEPPSIRRLSPEGIRLIRAAGLWGGDLDQATTDGWTCHRVDGGAVLSADGQPQFRVEDPDEYRAQGFSPGGRTFVYATSPTVYLVTRRT